MFKLVPPVTLTVSNELLKAVNSYSSEKKTTAKPFFLAIARKAFRELMKAGLIEAHFLQIEEQGLIIALSSSVLSDGQLLINAGLSQKSLENRVISANKKNVNKKLINFKKA